MAATFNPPHPLSVFRYLKQALRDYVATGSAVVITVTTPPTHAASAATVVAGTIEVDPAVGMPPAVTVVLTQASTVKGTQSAPVTFATGAFTTSFAGGTCVAGTATATVSATGLESATTPAFTLT